MSRKRTSIVMLLVGGAVWMTACAGSSRLPGDTVALVTPLSLGPPPIYALIGYRAELDLTSEQITELDHIAQQLEEENQLLIEELQETAQPNRAGGQLVVRTEGEELLKQIRENQTKAVEAVEALLSEEQRDEVCRLYGDTGEAREREPENRRATHRDTVVETRVIRPIEWQWCSEDRPDSVRELRAGQN